MALIKKKGACICSLHSARAYEKILSRMSLTRTCFQVFWLSTQTAKLALSYFPMVAKFNPFPDPKKGKGRTLLKRPAMKKNKTWDAVKYTRTTSLAAGPGGQRMDRFKWKRSLTQLLTATPLNVVKMLRADRILPKWEGKVCPRCEKGTLSGLKLEAGTGMPKQCSHWKCRVYINPQHLHRGWPWRCCAALADPPHVEAQQHFQPCGPSSFLWCNILRLRPGPCLSPSIFLDTVRCSGVIPEIPHVYSVQCSDLAA